MPDTIEEAQWRDLNNEDQTERADNNHAIAESSVITARARSR
jgi:hypothetical protein